VPGATGAAAGGRAGLAGMRERVLGAGGRFSVTSEPGRGARLEARLPVGEADG
jgi:signal transduction histidine kinase